jgi:acetyl-CoA acetyltransferase family protein
MAALFPLESMGETAENIATQFSISRREQDEFALESQRRAVRARDSVFQEEIVPISVQQAKGPDLRVDKDETPRGDTDLGVLAKLRPAFREGGTVTAGNSSGLNDGAAALLLMEASYAQSLGLKPMAIWRGCASAGVNPRVMGLGPIPATQKLLHRLGLRMEQLDLIEINEAFAVQTLVCARELQISRDKLNVHGGAIALGHPLGASGARLVVTLTHEMVRRGALRGLAALCVGVGQGLAVFLERP